MLDIPILEVIIGMIFIYSLLSILVTQVNTVIATVFKLRARHLRDGITELIQDPELAAKLLTHPLVRLVNSNITPHTAMTLPNQRLSEDEARRMIKGTVNAVTWINPKTFTNVLVNLLRVDSDRELFGALLDIVDGMPNTPERRRLRLLINQLMETGEGLDELREVIAGMHEAVYREALTQALDAIDDEIGQLGVDTSNTVSLKAGLRKLTDPFLRTALETILTTSKTLEHAETQIMDWFNEQMDRTSSAYKRSMGMLSLFVGLLIAVVLNVDTLHIARTLWEDPALRTQIEQIASQTDLVALNRQAQQAAMDAENVNEETIEDIVTDIVEASNAALDTINTLFGLRLPLGWRLNPVDTSAPLVLDSDGDGEPDSPAVEGEYTAAQTTLLQDAGNLWNYIPGNSPYWLSLVLAKLLGLLTTGIAIAQGAPFWFNLLNQLTRGGTRGE